MPATIRRDIERPSDRVREMASDIPPAVVSDAMERLGAVCSAISPVSTDVNLVGPAVTVDCMVGDNLMAHKAIEFTEPGDVLVINARSHEDTAVWGEVMTQACVQRDLAGVVVDGAIRDVQQIREYDIPVFCRSAVPAGPHKGWGGRINTSIQCGGTAVAPGDLIIGDDDGVVVVPNARAEAVLKRARRRLEREQDWQEAIESGASSLEAIGREDAFEGLDIEYLDGMPNDETA